jgi:hypothetical protein
MKYKILEVESNLIHRNIILLDAATTARDFSRDEQEMVKACNPFYVQHQLVSGDLEEIQEFEELGFRYIEFRISRYLKLNEQPLNTRHFYPFRCELVGDSEENRKAIIDIAANHISDDRFTRDPRISGELARKRLELYILKSLNSFPRQFVYGLINQQTSELLGFRTGIFAEPGLVKYFYYFMKPEYNDPKYISMLETGVIEELAKRKITRIEAVTSGFNVQEMNDTTLLQGFKVEKTMILLRKIFGPEQLL